MVAIDQCKGGPFKLVATRLAWLEVKRINRNYGTPIASNVLLGTELPIRVPCETCLDFLAGSLFLDFIRLSARWKVSFQ